MWQAHASCLDGMKLKYWNTLSQNKLKQNPKVSTPCTAFKIQQNTL